MEKAINKCVVHSGSRSMRQLCVDFEFDEFAKLLFKLKELVNHWWLKCLH
jgi:hypothetical protein